jgi:tRNA A58 N-methylase Trm61
LSKNATIVLRDACKDGFMTKECDCIFLDLPSPWLALEHCKSAMNTVRGGRLVSFSPCIGIVFFIPIILTFSVFLRANPTSCKWT